jgi:hypothetical protein
MFPEQLLGLYPKTVSVAPNVSQATPEQIPKLQRVSRENFPATEKGKRRSFTLWVNSHRHQIQVEEA